MPDRSLQEDVLDAFLEGRWYPTTTAHEENGKFTVTCEDNHGQKVSHTDELLSEAHNRTMDKVRDAIQKGKFSP